MASSVTSWSSAATAQWERDGFHGLHALVVVSGFDEDGTSSTRVACEPGDLTEPEIDDLFGRLDVDRSGSLSTDELRAFLSEISKEKRGHRNVGDEELAYALGRLDAAGGDVCKGDLAAFLRELPTSHGWGNLLKAAPS